MWTRRGVKSRAKSSVKSNYLRMIAVCFVVAVLAGAYSSSTQILRTNTETPQDPGITKYVEETIQKKTGVGVKNVLVVSTAETLINRYLGSFSLLAISAEAVDDYMEHNFTLTFIVLLFGMVISVFYWLFVKNILLIGEKRFLMETRIYHESRINRIFYLYRSKVVKNPAWIMFCKAWFQFWWSLTIVGGIIKHYEYYMIPFIVAENPTVDRKTAFAMSKKMMRGNKWRMFVLQISFFWWHLLGLFTFGLLDIFFLNAYTSAAEVEVYMELRRKMLELRNTDNRVFVDKYLDRIPSEDEVLISILMRDDEKMPNMKPYIYEPDTYPAFLYGRKSRWHEVVAVVDGNRPYHITSYILLFFMVSVLGWVFEVLIELGREEKFQLIGLLHGPWLPLVGLGAVLAVVLFRRWMKNPWITFGLITLFYTVLEYLASLYFEVVEGTKLWDFSGYFLQINGRVCLGVSVASGLLGCAFLYYAAPKMDDFLGRFSLRKKRMLCMVLCAMIMVDVIVVIALELRGIV
ncbi:DUF975 family protein [Hespellia stercorisuis]|uniref:DUF975 family protein n=1 Tax=Hespellia stercorisuis DSM 15480 TaxID=1121950 RepID=A0A1M6Q2Q7_9FIRM|nr:DUF975 family protein [Hespellia stercorisuis]SHK14480.1 Protein of unknown function [Hespellia stercorisuis DSM 15480]